MTLFQQLVSGNVCAGRSLFHLCVIALFPSCDASARRGSDALELPPSAEAPWERRAPAGSDLRVGIGNLAAAHQRTQIAVSDRLKIASLMDTCACLWLMDADVTARAGRPLVQEANNQLGHRCMGSEGSGS